MRPYKPYSGRNPRTGEPVAVPAKRLPFFKVGKELKELVNYEPAPAPSRAGDDEDDDHGDGDGEGEGDEGTEAEEHDA